MGMATPGQRDSTAHLVFRSRAVRMAGWCDLVLGTALVLGGIALGVVHGVRYAVPLGVTLAVLGVALFLSGLSRTTARMTVTRTQVRWTWSFATQELALEELDDAALVEKGAPASGAAWAGFLAGGLAGVLAWWLFDVAAAFVSSEPSLGPVELVAIRHYGAPVSIKPIGAWSSRASHSEANQALQYLQAAIAASPRHPRKELPILRTDDWEQPGGH